MNKVILIGRLTRDPEIRYSQGQQPVCIARYTLAVDRRFKREGDEQTADFVSCVAFGRAGEFAEKYLHQGSKIAIEGRIQTGNYKDRDGKKVYTTDVVIEAHEFAESRGADPQQQTGSRPPQAAPRQQTQQRQQGSRQNRQRQQYQPPNDYYDGSGDFIDIPDGMDEDGLPFR